LSDFGLAHKLTGKLKRDPSVHGGTKVETCCHHHGENVVAMVDVTLRLLQKKTVTLQLCAMSAPCGLLIDDGGNMAEMW
jgi:hypothetical protein